MSNLLHFFNVVDSFVWGPPLLILLVGTGIYLTLRLGLLQILKLPLAIRITSYNVCYTKLLRLSSLKIPLYMSSVFLNTPLSLSLASSNFFSSSTQKLPSITPQ